MKHNTVIPVTKTKHVNTEDVNNYRPIDNTVTSAKIVEKAALEQINYHLLAHDLHTVTQFGYKKGHSSETVVLKIVNDVQNEVLKIFLQWYSSWIFPRPSAQPIKTCSLK